MAVAVGTSITELGEGRRMEDDAPCPGLGVKGPPRGGCSTAASLCRAPKQAQPLLGPSKREGKGAGGYIGTHQHHGPMDPSLTQPTPAVWQCFGTCMDLPWAFEVSSDRDFPLASSHRPLRRRSLKARVRSRRF